MAQQTAQTTQTELQSRKQNNEQKKSDRGLRQNKTASKTSMAQLAASAELFSSGRTDKHTAEAASRFGNQTMIGLAEKGSALKDGIIASAGVLSGESPPSFGESVPATALQTETSLPQSFPPAFSAGAPASGIQSVGAAAGSYL